jgi:hypothetical protein
MSSGSRIPQVEIRLSGEDDGDEVWNVLLSPYGRCVGMDARRTETVRAQASSTLVTGLGPRNGEPPRCSSRACLGSYAYRSASACRERGVIVEPERLHILSPHLTTSSEL